MGKALHVAWWLSLFHLLVSESFLMLPAPRNVRIESYNLKQKLIWDPVPSADNATVTYTVEYNTLSKLETWTTINCSDNTKTECDFTKAVPLTYRIQLRIKAHLGQQETNWTETSPFQATRDTVVGPVTSMNVTPEYGSLFISFSAPFQDTPEEWNLGYNIWNLGYNICHWKKQTPEEKTCIDTKKTIYTLPDVEPWTIYCIEVKPTYRYDATNKIIKGNSSDVLCKETSASAATRAGYIAIILFLAMSSVFVVGIGCFFLLHKFHKDIKRWFYPPFRIPPHIEEYFYGNFTNAFVVHLESEDHEEECYDKLSIVSAEERN